MKCSKIEKKVKNSEVRRTRSDKASCGGKAARAKAGTHMPLLVSERGKQNALRQKGSERNGSKNQRKVMLQL